MIVKGREFAVVGEGENVEVDFFTTGTLYCALVAEIDLTKESTKANFNQVSFKVLNSATNYPSLTKQDINSGNASDTLYQYELARFRLTSSGISDFTDRRTFLEINSIYEDYKERLAKIEDGSAYVLNTVTTHEFSNGRVSGSITKQGRIAVLEFKIASGSGDTSVDIGIPDAFKPLREVSQYFVTFPYAGVQDVESHASVSVWKEPSAQISFTFSSNTDNLKGTLTYITAEPESTE